MEKVLLMEAATLALEPNDVSVNGFRIIPTWRTVLEGKPSAIKI